MDDLGYHYFRKPPYRAIENGTLIVVALLNVVMFTSYVSLPEGISVADLIDLGFLSGYI